MIQSNIYTRYKTKVEDKNNTMKGQKYMSDRYLATWVRDSPTDPPRGIDRRDQVCNHGNSAMRNLPFFCILSVLTRRAYTC